MPLLKLFDAGRENTTLFRVIEKNTRQPVHVLGDLRAQVAACRAGERGLTDILRALRRPGRARLHGRAAAARRAADAGRDRRPAGRRATASSTGSTASARTRSRCGSRCCVRVAGDELSIDFTGTSPQVEASVNCPVGLVFAACYCAIKGIAEREIPNCEGYMRPIRINAPEGTIVNPVLPAACGARGVIGYRVYDAIIGALADVRARPGDRGRRGRPDADRLRRLRERPAVRDDRGARRHLGRAGRQGRARGSLEPARQPRRTSRSSCSRQTCRSR